MPSQHVTSNCDQQLSAVVHQGVSQMGSPASTVSACVAAVCGYEGLSHIRVGTFLECKHTNVLHRLQDRTQKSCTFGTPAHEGLRQSPLKISQGSEGRCQDMAPS